MKSGERRIDGIVGHCGSYPVFLGFAPARLLYSNSFADVLDESSGRGYQRPRNLQHSADFKRYISTPNASTIPLTFNLRNDLKKNWKIKTYGNNHAVLTIQPGKPCMAQVDCQHRLGELKDCGIPLAFMAFVGLDLRSEMSMFVVINSKAKGLSSSLTDFHQGNLMTDIVTEAPHLYIAKRLNEDPASPWFKLINIGGNPTAGLRRRTSLRMMQRAVKRFLIQHDLQSLGGPEKAYNVVCEFWRAVAQVFSGEWSDPRHHLLTKGIGLYSLTQLLSDIVSHSNGKPLNVGYFAGRLIVLRKSVNWKSDGMFAGVGGQKGAKDVYLKLKQVLN